MIPQTITDQISNQDLSLELLRRAITRTQGALARAEETVKVLKKKQAAQASEFVRQIEHRVNRKS